MAVPLGALLTDPRAQLPDMQRHIELFWEVNAEWLLEDGLYP
jgi:hypothetical protein